MPDPIARMIDANANRAAEGLRVLEDVARFALDDAGLSERAKAARHAVRMAAGSISPGDAVGRSVAEDVGRAITTETESRRTDLRGVVTAAAKRAQEAIRVLEEAAKTRGGNWTQFERARYEAYDLELAVLAKLAPAAPQWRLCVLVTESLCRRPWEAVVQAAIRGGANCVQLREKSLPDKELLSRARSLVALCKAGGASAIVNDRVDIAVLAGADGVHLGQGDLGIAEARRIGGHALLVGVSTATIDQAIAAAEAGASYCGVGPMFTSAAKQKSQLAGLAYLEEYLRSERVSRVPHLAISGINADRARELAAVGCHGVAVSSAVCGADDPEAAARKIASVISAVPG